MSEHRTGTGTRIGTGTGTGTKLETVILRVLVIPVKNGFSDLTKEQKGRDWPRKDVVNRHQVSALREGCRERKEATCLHPEA